VPAPGQTLHALPRLFYRVVDAAAAILPS
jgi:hypothetical protein